MAILIGQYALTATATSIADALGIDVEGNDATPGQSRAQYLSIQYNEDGTADAFLGGPNLAVGPPPVDCCWKFPQVAANIPPQPFKLVSPQGSSGIDLRSIFVIGTANAANIIFVIAVI